MPGIPAEPQSSGKLSALLPELSAERKLFWYIEVFYNNKQRDMGKQAM